MTTMMYRAMRGIFALAILAPHALGDIVISEIADKGSAGVCGGRDWIELYNPDAIPVNLGAGYLLHDDKGAEHEESFSFPPETPLLLPGEYRVICTRSSLISAQATASIPDPLSPRFGIGGDDTITLLRLDTAGNDNATTTSVVRQNDMVVVSSVGPMPNTRDRFNVSFALYTDTGMYNYTSTPTPGLANVFTELPSDEELLALHRQKMAEQAAQGRQFFGVDERGYKVSDGMDDLLELQVTMDDEDYAYLKANASYEVYRPFQSARVVTTAGEEIISLTSQGRIRPKGQSTLFVGLCVGGPIPYQLELNSANTSQTLFGVERLYLRNHMLDYSYMRDYAYHRMLARFGLPHLRARKAHFYINDELIGLYTVLEAPDQEYVFARNFPNYNPESYALYKFKSVSLGCGMYTMDELAKAEKMVDNPSIPPYSFQRGEHKGPVEVLGLSGWQQCSDDFQEKVFDVDFIQAAVAYLRYNKDCGDMLIKEKLVDRDLGTKDWDDSMEELIREHLFSGTKCGPSCPNSVLKYQVDIDNILKSFAFYAVTVNSDSPLINGNNFYLAQAGDEAYGGPGGWKLLPYDFNTPYVAYCQDEVCNSRMVHWSIARPTCQSLESNNLAGPILADPELHAMYSKYVEEFVETIYGNETFFAELQEHAQIMDKAVRNDFWALYGAFYDKELSSDPSDWWNKNWNFPLLPTMKARTQDVRDQIAAIKEGTFPRGPHVGVEGDNHPWEFCADWRMDKLNTTGCELDCNYEGCQMDDWTVPSFCNEETKKCLHGDADSMCKNVFDATQYAGMENTSDGRSTFCLFTGGVPVKASECPAVGAVTKTASAETSSGSLPMMSLGGWAVAGVFMAW